MSSTSKYANLPFIASGEKDVFETDDLPEADQISTQQPIPDASIEIIPFGTSDAFHKFISSEEKQQIKPGESKESYVEKFNRIKAEIEDLKSIASKNDEVNVALDVDNLATKLASLQELRSKNQSAITSTITNDVKSIEKGKNVEESALIKYELFCKPDNEQVFELSKINFLEQRIKKIENIIGINESPKDVNFLSDYLKDQSVMNIVIQLSNKVVQLDSSSLERIDSRLHTIIEKLNQISEKKSNLENLGVVDKLNELFNFYVKTSQSRKILPNILERLQVLNDVQQQACQFSANLSNLREAQNEIQISLEKNSQNLKTVKELVETKSENITQIIADFNARLDKLKN